MKLIEKISRVMYSFIMGTVMAYGVLSIVAGGNPIHWSDGYKDVFLFAIIIATIMITMYLSPDK